ncbi:MAG TPA: MOSC domain-containing protein [Roseiflexaceae bacterium]|nr:MOSC domain-containing protein [Roseiflexaceae bacterium]
MHIRALHIGQPQVHHDERGTWRSAIFRTSVSDPVALGMRGLAGDQVADTDNHGSPDQAVCCHPLAHYEYWNELYAGLGFDPELGPGSVGENWTIAGGDEAAVCVGDVFRVGSALVQVTAPRYPCMKQERKVGRPDFLKRTMATRRTGWYVRVLEAGQVQAGDELVLEGRPQPAHSIALVNEHMHGDFDVTLARQLLEVPELAVGWKRIIRHLLEKRQ